MFLYTIEVNKNKNTSNFKINVTKYNTTYKLQNYISCDGKY